jgi:phage terminase small subunit
MISNDSTTAAPDPPRHLSIDAAIKWFETWSRLDHNHFDACRDGDVLAEYCEAWADIREAAREIEKLEQISKTKTGTVTSAQDSIETSRLNEQLAAAMDRFDQAGEELGLSLCAPESIQWSYDDYISVLQPLPQELADEDNKAADPTALGRARIWTLRDVWTALQRSCGNMAAAARLLSETYGATCTPDAISRLTKKYPQLREAIEECEDVLLEFCRYAVETSAIAGDACARRFVLTHFHPKYKDADGNRHRT